VRAAWTAGLAEAATVTAARERLAQGRLRLSGLTGAARALIPLILADRPLLVVLPQERLVEQFAVDMRTLSAELGLEGAVLPFPAPGPPPFRGMPRHPDAALRRGRALHAALRHSLRALVGSPAGLLRPALARDLFETQILAVGQGEELTPEMLLEALVEAGYRREDPVSSPGQVARRGGILDVFPPDCEEPVRVEFDGERVDSLRRFDPETQRSLSPLLRIEIVPLSDLFVTRSTLPKLRDRLAERLPPGGRRDATLEKLDRGLPPEEITELLPLASGATVPAWAYLEGATALVVEPEAVASEAQAYHSRAWEDSRAGVLPAAPAELLVPAADLEARLVEPHPIELREIDPTGDSLHMSSRLAPRYAGDLRRLVQDLSRHEGRSVLFLGNPGRADRLRAVLREDGLRVGEAGPVEVRVGTLDQGFEIAGLALRVLADGDVFPEEVHLHGRRRGAARGFLSDFRDLRVGDLVVHEDHGIGRFEGLEVLEVGGMQRELMVLGYQGGDRLKVPVEAFDRVQKYMSAEAARPAIHRLGSGSWTRVKKRVRKAMRDMAAELLRLYAERKARPGHAFSAQGPWEREFEEAFEYEETPDQAMAIAEVERDMSATAPMDRLICGDVGYGKTEVAMRAAMRAVLDAKQVAVLAPTTVLAFQHWKTFRSRFAPFPVAVEMISRFRSPRQIRTALERLARGQLDIAIGTHRLLSKDVVFRDLGLLVVDEEQRFGVAAKERLKRAKATVDCLTLSATPIPRTLQMGLAGIRDMSVIETPPKDRLAIQTSIVEFSTEVVATAIRQELAREGQVFLVHNRVTSIYSLAHLVQRLVPEARVVVAHGQMPEAELERAMLAFVEGRADVLVATAIIENGLDIPRANTLLVNRADRFGLAQLYQLRGRVGRSDRRAWAYLLVPPGTVLSELAAKRLAAIREFSELGSGFRIAALDLELRGAGNLLGGEQSGHIEAVGLDLYVKLLEQTILELKGEVREGLRAALNLKVDLRIPSTYVPEAHQRMSLYKRLSQANLCPDVERLREELRERYGPIPDEAQTLLAYAEQRVRAEALGVQQVDRGASSLRVALGTGAPLSPEGLVGLVTRTPGASLTPEGVLCWPLGSARDPVLALGRLLDSLERLSAQETLAGTKNL